MIMPSMSTPVSKCEELSLYTEQMLAKFAERPRLIELIPRLAGSRGALEAADLAHRNEQRALMRLRIDVDFENYLSDRRVRRTRKLVEMHDGRRGGRIAALIMPDGSLDFSRVQGAKQIEAMRALEARLAATVDLWPEALTEQADIVQHRMRHAAALDARDEGQQRVKDLRTARNAAKERFLQVYAEAASLVAAEFPRDRVTQALFFLDAHDRRGRSARDGDELPEEPGDELPEEDELSGDPATGA
jgi:hypothetical protein